MTFAEPWTSERITADGRRKLRQSGFAPPRSVTCPFCGSRDTRLENPFGPTRCRAIFWCNHCRQPFEQFKAI
jgi:ring-1,2-phenylacetyl-CoA epoxidase subunit PaaD